MKAQVSQKRSRHQRRTGTELGLCSHARLDQGCAPRSIRRRHRRGRAQARSSDLDKVLDLTDTATLDALGIASSDLVRADHRFTQQIGEAAHEQAFQAIRSPFATGVDHVPALFPEQLAGTVMDVTLLGEWNTPGDLAHLQA